MNKQSVSSSTTFFKSAHAQYLAQMTDQEFWSYAVELAQEKTTAAPLPDEYVDCELIQGHCIVSLSMLREVVPAKTHVTLLPHSPHWFAGITAWRGEIIAVIDLASYLWSAMPDTDRSHHDKHPQPPQSNAMLIASLDHYHFGLSVSLRSYITTLLTEKITPAPDTILKEALTKVVTADSNEDAFVLHIPTLLTQLIQHIKVN